jgi:hypothetical protein
MEYLTTEQELKVQTDRLEKQIKINEELEEENHNLLDDIITMMGEMGDFAKLLGVKYVKCPTAKSIKEAIEKLTEERDDLKRWKEEMLQVESEWDCQKVGKILGIGLGQSIRKNIEPKIRELIKEREYLEDEVIHLKATYTDQ